MKALYLMSPEEKWEYAKPFLANLFSEEILKQYHDMIMEINYLKREKNCVILGHNYMRPEVYYGISDFVGDSYALAVKATEVKEKVILFNGVYFMAESAKILNPEKRVWIADKHASCSLVKGITVGDVEKLRAEYPQATVVTYINSSAEVKAVSDVICTSSNALRIVEALPAKQILFLPDQHLAGNIARMTKKEIIPFRGSCYVHEKFTPEVVIQWKEQQKDLTVLAHPECPIQTTALADFIGSTSAMAEWIKDNQKKVSKILLLTEGAMVQNLKAEFPQIQFFGPREFCINMQLITLPKIIRTLEEEKIEVQLDENVRQNAEKSLRAMLTYAR